MESANSKKMGNKKILKLVLISISATLVIGVLTFLLVFHVKKVEIIGNTRYTEDEIKSMALTKYYSSNSVLVTWLDGNQEVRGIPFINSFKIEKVSNSEIRIIVSEKQIIGYINSDNGDAFFDKDGVVVEVVEPKVVESEVVDGKQVIVGEEIDDKDVIKPEAIEEVVEEATFNAAVTNVPLVEGLEVDTIALNKKLKVADPRVFNTVWGIARMVEKFEVQPDKVVFGADSNVTMYYGDIRVLIGDSSLLEEKIIRAAAILPNLAGKSGELHLEDYQAGVDTIVFSADVPVGKTSESESEEETEEEAEGETGEESEEYEE